ncbi:MAG: hypothetical protein J5733_12060 [Bacteroidaceae bacterium]|nr:hypothetical protein [Bacteroidaceae bacterium]
MDAIVIIILFGATVFFALKYWMLRRRIVTLSEKKPKADTAQSRAMQLGNELKPYIKEDGDTIFVEVLK